FFRQEDVAWLHDTWRELMREQLVPGVTLHLETQGQGMPPMLNNDEGSAVAGLFGGITQALEIPYDPEIRGGSSDAGFASSFGCPALDGFGAVGSQAHSAREHILLSAVPQKAALLTGLVAALA